MTWARALVCTKWASTKKSSSTSAPRTLLVASTPATPNGCARPFAWPSGTDVAVGAHTSFPDLVGFGRRNIEVSPEEARNDVIYQIGALQAFTSGHRLQHVKPHGAMYNRAVVDEDLARSICDAVLEVDPDLILIALAGSRWVDVALDMGLRVAREIFADRALNPDGTLVSRTKEGSVLHDVDEVADRSLRMVQEGKATAVNGDTIDVEADSLCIHGDTPGAVEMAKVLRQRLDAESVAVTPLSQLV